MLSPLWEVGTKKVSLHPWSTVVSVSTTLQSSCYEEIYLKHRVPEEFPTGSQNTRNSRKSPLSFKAEILDFAAVAAAARVLWRFLVRGHRSSWDSHACLEQGVINQASHPVAQGCCASFHEDAASGVSTTGSRGIPCRF
jgi:hypothetical protein